MEGECQADLVMTDRGFYIVKWAQNRYGPRTLINEAIGSELLFRLGIASPEWAVVDASEDFLRDNPQPRIRVKSGYRPVEAGLHFGSKVPEGKVYDAISLFALSRVENLCDFLRVFVFDLWVNNQDRRQTIFCQTGDELYSAKMIDQGRAFGFDGFDWRPRDWTYGCQSPLVPAVYFAKSSEPDFESTVRKISSLREADFDQIQRNIPTEWIGENSDALQQMFQDLLRRSRRLPSLLITARSNFSQ